MDETKVLLKDLSENQANLVKDIRDTENELVLLEKQKKTDTPGHAIEQLMQLWGNQPVKSAQDIEMFANELWKTKEQFERELK